MTLVHETPSLEVTGCPACEGITEVHKASMGCLIASTRADDSMSKTIVRKCDGCGETQMADAYLIDVTVNNHSGLTGVKELPELDLEACSISCLRAVLLKMEEALGKSIPGDAP